MPKESEKKKTADKVLQDRKIMGAGEDDVPFSWHNPIPMNRKTDPAAKLIRKVRQDAEPKKR